MSHNDTNRLVDEEASSNNGDLVARQSDDSSDHIDGLSASYEEPSRYTSQLASLFIIINVTIGAALLALPYSMQVSGIFTSLVIQVVFLASIIITLMMCTELTVKSNVNSFHRLVKIHCHPFIYKYTQFTLLLIVFGTTVAFMVIIGDQADRVLRTVTRDPTFCKTWYMNRRFIISFVTLTIIKPLCCAKTVDFLKYASFAGVLSIGFIVYVVISQFLSQGHLATDINYLPKNWTDVGTILPVFCLAYQAHLSWVPTAATIRKEEKRTTYVTVGVAMIVSTIVYVVVSTLAVLTFGSSIQKDLTESYPGRHWTIVTTTAIVAFKSAVTLAPAFLPARLSLVDLLSQSSGKFNRLSEPAKRYSVTIVTLSVALMLALFVPDIMIAVDILGSLSVMFIFTLPAMSYLNLVRLNRLVKQQMDGVPGGPVWTRKDQLKRGISFFFIVFGVAMTAMVLFKSVQNIMSSTPSPPLCVV